MHLDRCGGGIDSTEIVGGEFDLFLPFMLSLWAKKPGERERG